MVNRSRPHVQRQVSALVNEERSKGRRLKVQSVNVRPKSKPVVKALEHEKLALRRVRIGVLVNAYCQLKIAASVGCVLVAGKGQVRQQIQVNQFGVRQVGKHYRSQDMPVCT